MDDNRVKLKVIMDASPINLEQQFNDWTLHSKAQVLTTAIEYSSALQKFVLCSTYRDAE